MANNALVNAREEMASQNEYRVRYAALELRQSLECLVYERAYSYREEIPPAEYLAWQPRKVLQLLLDIDPKADQGCAISIGAEAVPGVAADPKDMKPLGTEHVLGMKTLKAHYDALGSYLHSPTLKKMEDGGHSLTKLRSRCEQVAAEVEKVLSSTLWGVNFKQTTEMDCIRCGRKVRRRVPLMDEIEGLTASCYECNAGYLITQIEPGRFKWKPQYVTGECPSEECDSEFCIWESDFKIAATWSCRKCLGRFQIVYGATKLESAHETD